MDILDQLKSLVAQNKLLQQQLAAQTQLLEDLTGTTQLQLQQDLQAKQAQQATLPPATSLQQFWAQQRALHN